jgi:hypothetical protein
VVGINVATAGNQVSFLVPAGHLAALLHQGADAPGEWLDTVASQVLAHQRGFAARVLAEPLPTVPLGPFRVPGKLGRYLNCWGDTAEQDDLIYQLVYQGCRTTDRVYLNGDHFTGRLQFRHEWFRAADVGAVRFYGFLEDHFEKPHLKPRGDEQDVTNYRCETSLVEQDGFRAAVAFCARGYRRLPGLYDALFTATSLVAADQALHTTLALSRAYLESLGWGPGKASP